MNRFDHHRLQPLFTTVLLLLGLFALAMAQNSRLPGMQRMRAP